MDFVVLNNEEEREGMIGNEHLLDLGLTDITQYNTKLTEEERNNPSHPSRRGGIRIECRGRVIIA